MEILLANHSGFCFGVKKAVETAEKTIKDNPDKNIKTLGPIIHNPQLIKKLDEKNVNVIYSVDDIEKGILITRAHGTPKKTIDEATKKGLTVVNITCPFVQKIHNLTIEYEQKGYQIFIFGEKNHPEVKGISNNLKNPIIITNIKDVPKKTFDKGLFVSQTTQEEEVFHKIEKELKSTVNNLVVDNTICKATKLRQDAAKKIAKQVDLMIIIGGKNSGNTRRLYKICKDITKTMHIETKEEIDNYDFAKIKKLGISAGASTPSFIINDILNFLNNKK